MTTSTETNAQNPSQQKESKDGLYKTELCQNFSAYGTCSYGQKCRFAHGRHELRNRVRDPKYKTQHCKNFTLHGKCSYGSRCTFLHALPNPVPRSMYPWPDPAYEYHVSPRSLGSAGGGVITPPHTSPTYANPSSSFGYDPAVRSPKFGPIAPPVTMSPYYHDGTPGGSLLSPGDDYPPHPRYDVQPYPGTPYAHGAARPAPATGASKLMPLPHHPNHPHQRGRPSLELEIPDSIHPMEPPRRFIPSTSTLGSPNTTMSIHSPQQSTTIPPSTAPSNAPGRAWPQQRSMMHPYALQEDLGIESMWSTSTPGANPAIESDTPPYPPSPPTHMSAATEEDAISGECILRSKSTECNSSLTHPMVHSIQRPSIVPPPVGLGEPSGHSPHIYDTSESPHSVQYSPSHRKPNGGSSGENIGRVGYLNRHPSHPQTYNAGEWAGSVSSHMTQKSTPTSRGQSYPPQSHIHSYHPSHASPHTPSHIPRPYPLQRGDSAFFCPPAHT